MWLSDCKVTERQLLCGKFPSGQSEIKTLAGSYRVVAGISMHEKYGEAVISMHGHFINYA